jgi:hypothetical protein
VLSSGLSHCERARPLFETFVKTIRMAAEAYCSAGEDTPAKLSGFHVKEELSLNDGQYLRLSLLLNRESWVFGGSQGNPGDDWTRDVLVLALAFEEIETIDDYLDVLAERHHQRSADSTRRGWTCRLTRADAARRGREGGRGHPGLCCWDRQDAQPERDPDAGVAEWQREGFR